MTVQPMWHKVTCDTSVTLWAKAGCVQQDAVRDADTTRGHVCALEDCYDWALHTDIRAWDPFCSCGWRGELAEVLG